ncbi:MAG: hypothetical protein AB9856_20705 [Cellulosilyticaceae bacterium]
MRGGDENSSSIKELIVWTSYREHILRIIISTFNLEGRKENV